MKLLLRLLLLTWYCLVSVKSVDSDVASTSSGFPNDPNGPDCAMNPRNPVPVKEAATKAKEVLAEQPSSVPIGERLAVMILFSRGFSSANQKSSRLEFLHCALLKLQKYLMSQTNADVYIWALNSTSNPISIPTWFNAKDFPRTFIMELPSEAWKIPCGLSSEKNWVVRKHFDIDYYLMGRWRLTFSLDFAKEMGYEYHLQFDDDSMINTMIPYNIIAKFQESKYNMGVFSDLIGEVSHVTLGLPELSYYWLKVNHFTPKGQIVANLRNKDLNSLNSDNWNRMYHPGYFMIFRVSFWFSWEVQDYLTTILRSGRDIEGRWQEQAVMNMIRLLFVGEKELWVMNEVDIGHDRHKRANFENWCIKQGFMKQG
jgi:hypothetical protein